MAAASTKDIRTNAAHISSEVIMAWANGVGSGATQGWGSGDGRKYPDV